MTYPELLKDIKTRIRQAQVKAALSANAEMLALYWDIGRMIDQRQNEESWGAGIIPRLSKDIRNELPEHKGFSERNLDRMLRFYREYRQLLISPQPVAKLPKPHKQISPLAVAKSGRAIGPQAVAQLTGSEKELNQSVMKLPWVHNVLLLEKIKDLAERLWYMEAALNGGWSRDTLASFIQSQAYQRQGKAVHNFTDLLPSPKSDLAANILKDPYIFDFLTLEEPFHERELETGLIQHLEKFLLELGTGFAFVGRQYHLAVSEHDYYIDLLFYHLKLHCYVVIELKKGSFKPEYAGKLSFYCSVVDDVLRHGPDQQTIGLMLCQNKDKVLAEYILRGIKTPIGVSDYELTRALPNELKSSLPTIEEIERALEQDGNER